MMRFFFLLIMYSLEQRLLAEQFLARNTNLGSLARREIDLVDFYHAK